MGEEECSKILYETLLDEQMINHSQTGDCSKDVETVATCGHDTICCCPSSRNDQKYTSIQMLQVSLQQQNI